jgi:hypothetical protein
VRLSILALTMMSAGNNRARQRKGPLLPSTFGVRPKSTLSTQSSREGSFEAGT